MNVVQQDGQAAHQSRIIIAWIKRLPSFLLLGALLAVGFRYHLWKLFDDAYLTDEGWIGGMIWRSPDLYVRVFAEKGSFYNLHVSPFLSLVSFGSFVFPFNAALWAALFFSLPYVLIAWSLLPKRDRDTPLKKLVLLIAALLASFSGAIPLHTAYPHFEIWFIVFVVLGVKAYALDYKKTSLLLLILAALVREDFGFYLFLPLVSIWFFHGRRNKSFTNEIRVGIGLALYSVVTSIGRIFIAGPVSVETTLFGDPFLSHLSFSFLQDRLTQMITSSSGVLVLTPFLVMGLIAWSYRSVAIHALLIGVPQMGMSFIAFLPAAGGFELHYGITLTAGMLVAYQVLVVFPKLSSKFQDSKPQETHLFSKLPLPAVMALMWFGLSGIAVASSHTMFDSLGRSVPGLREQNEVFQIIRDSRNAGLRIDPALTALMPGDIYPKQLMSSGNPSETCSLINTNAAFFGKAALLKSPLFAYGPEDGLAPSIGILRSEHGCSLDLPRLKYKSRNQYVYLGSSLGSQFQSLKGTARKFNGPTSAGHIVYGPGVSFPEGKYNALISYSLESEDVSEASIFEVFDGIKILKSQLLPKTENRTMTQRIQFEVSSSSKQKIETRVFWSGTGTISVNRITIWSD